MFLNADGNLLKIEAVLCWDVLVSFGTNSNDASDNLKLCVCTLRSSDDKYSGKFTAMDRLVSKFKDIKVSPLAYW